MQTPLLVVKKIFLCFQSSLESRSDVTINKNLKFFSTELVYKLSSRLLRNLFQNSRKLLVLEFSQHLQECMQNFHSTHTTSHGQHNIFVYKNLVTFTHGFEPLQLRPYTIVKKSNKTFNININGNTKRIVVNCLKSAFFFFDVPYFCAYYSIYHRFFSQPLSLFQTNTSFHRLISNFQQPKNCCICLPDRFTDDTTVAEVRICSV